jgi:hypothetical protein
MDSSDSTMQINEEDSSLRITENDLLVFLEYYFTIAKDNLNEILTFKNGNPNENLIYKSLNFWLNFSLNFKDISLINLIQSEIDKEKCIFIKNKLKDILLMIYLFLKNNLSNQGIILFFLIFYNRTIFKNISTKYFKNIRNNIKIQRNF